MKTIFLCLFSALSLLGYRDSARPTAAPVLYLIKKGQHEITPNRFSFTRKTALQFRATFNQSAVYVSKQAANQFDINKLYGFSDCDTYHQTASARFGWNWYNNALHIHAYCYRRGQRVAQELGTVPLNQPADYYLGIEGNFYVFRLNGRETRIQRGCAKVASSYRYLLYPYFGGDEVAPQDIRVQIEE